MHDPDVTEQQLLQASRLNEVSPFDTAERRAELVVGGFAAMAMASLWLLPVSGDWSPSATLICVAGLIAAMHVRFDIGGGFTVPVQVAFIPLLFTLPAQAVPLAVVLAVAMARVPATIRGESSPVRLALALGNSWFAIGPAFVVAIVGGGDAIAAQPLLAGALLGAQFAGDFVASAVRETLLRGASVREQLHEARVVYGVDIALTPAPLWITLESGSPVASVLVLWPVIVLLGSFARERRKRLDGVLELNTVYHGTALLLGDVIEADDGYTGEHSRTVVDLALAVGRQMGLPAERLRNLEFGALLHDIGKVAIPNEIINKPGKLDPHEWATIKTHTIEGQQMLDRIGGFMRAVGRIVRSHHERWDGTGYPDNLAGTAIPLEARIVTACDSYNAMTTARSYRAAMPVEAAVQELRQGTGSQFDPAVVDALLAVIAADASAAAHIDAAPVSPLPALAWH